MEISSLSASLSLLPSFTPSNNSKAFLRPTYSPIRPVIRSRPSNPSHKRGLVCNSLFGLGVPELAVIAGVAALVFGPKQLPEIGRTLGKSIKGFQQAAKEFEQELKKPEEGESSDDLLEAKPASQTTQEQENVVSSSKESS
ncbi:sec-independent protein translocase protein TATA, chloroplastic [Silene latifolia]|uniref:sec-independent protein translocase protein TATA, chloroplastic n=1 Tax=Silene latifolia TaxID=37657 RepID=UPI003D779A22